jgi:hypothetical protein
MNSCWNNIKINDIIVLKDGENYIVNNMYRIMGDLHQIRCKSKLTENIIYIYAPRYIEKIIKFK